MYVGSAMREKIISIKVKQRQTDSMPLRPETSCLQSPAKASAKRDCKLRWPRRSSLLFIAKSE
jgi:hypothetical protein